MRRPIKCTYNLNELKGWGRRDCTVIGNIKYFDNLALNVARLPRSVELKGMGRRRLLPHHSIVQLFACWNCGKSRTYFGGYLVFRSKLKLGTSIIVRIFRVWVQNFGKTLETLGGITGQSKPVIPNNRVSRLHSTSSHREKGALCWESSRDSESGSDAQLPLRRSLPIVWVFE
jgi:hypothetical protein